jgi:hypothetical protein
MLGVPSSPGLVGLALLAIGLAGAAVALARLLRRRAGMELEDLAASICSIATIAVLPFITWRFVEDMRLTTGLHGYDAAAAGPVQAYLPGYLVDNARALIPAGATYATAVSDSVPHASARKAFPSLALITLFPRRSVPLREADYVLTLGVAPSALVPVTRTWRARGPIGNLPAVLVGKVRK